MPILKKGRLQLYTGDGKGKTTAALGQTWRMLGWGGSVYFCQFLKPPSFETGEARLAEQFPDHLTFDRLTAEWNIAAADSDPAQFSAMQTAVADKLAEINQLAQTGRFDLIVLDELAFCLARNIAPWPTVAAIIDQRAPHTELIITGRSAPQQLIDAADLVSTILPTKHPYDNGTQARKGIEF